jgi:predicted transcriptional regulator
MKYPYANAEKVLPPELLKEIQRHYCGVLWVPSPNKYFEDRRKLVVALRQKKVTSREIAQLAGLSVRRVNQILREEKKWLSGPTLS